MISTVIFWYKHRHIEYEKKFSSIFKELDITSERTMWQVRLTLAVSTAMLIAGLLGIPRAMWIGIAVMSIMQPSREGVKQRVRLRAPGNILGGALFLILYTVLPGDVCSYIGIIGGIGAVSYTHLLCSSEYRLRGKLIRLRARHPRLYAAVSHGFYKHVYVCRAAA